MRLRLKLLLLCMLRRCCTHCGSCLIRSAPCRLEHHGHRVVPHGRRLLVAVGRNGPPGLVEGCLHGFCHHGRPLGHCGSHYRPLRRRAKGPLGRARLTSGKPLPMPLLLLLLMWRRRREEQRRRRREEELLRALGFVFVLFSIPAGLHGASRPLVVLSRRGLHARRLGQYCVEDIHMLRQCVQLRGEERQQHQGPRGFRQTARHKGGKGRESGINGSGSSCEERGRKGGREGDLLLQVAHHGAPAGRGLARGSLRGRRRRSSASHLRLRWCRLWLGGRVWQCLVPQPGHEVLNGLAAVAWRGLRSPVMSGFRGCSEVAVLQGCCEGEVAEVLLVVLPLPLPPLINRRGGLREHEAWNKEGHR